MTQACDHPRNIVVALQTWRLILNLIDDQQQLSLVLSQAPAHCVDLRDLGPQTGKQFVALPALQMGRRQQIADLRQCEAGALRARDDLDQPNRLRWIFAVAIGLTLRLYQTACLIETQARGSKAGAVGQFTDFHMTSPMLDIEVNFNLSVCPGSIRSSGCAVSSGGGRTWCTMIHLA